MLVVDTSSWVTYFKGEANLAIDEALQEGRVYLSPIVLAELLSANLNDDRKSQLLSFLQELPLFQTDFDHWARVGILRRKLASKGLNVSTPDAHIAQCSIDLNARLISKDKVFAKLAKLYSSLIL